MHTWNNQCKPLQPNGIILAVTSQANEEFNMLILNTDESLEL